MAYLEYGKIDEKAEKRMNELLKKSFKTYWKKKRTFDIIVTYNRNHPERGGFYYVSFLQEMLYKQE